MGWRRFFKRPHTFSFSEYLTSTRLHIARCLKEQGWRHTDYPDKALLHDEHLNLNDEIAAHLEQKHLLWELLTRHQLDYMPLSFPVNDSIYPKVLEEMKARDFDETTFWFLKPALLNNGDHIYLFDDLDDIAHYFKKKGHLEGDHVIQKAVHPPALIDGKKFTFRMLGVLTNEPSVYLYQTGYLNISGVLYDEGADLSTKNRHITNFLLEGKEAGITQILSHEYPHFKTQIYPKMCEMIKTILLALCAERPNFLSKHGHGKFELFGFDFILDESGRLWLLEINQGPDFPVDPKHPLFQTLWDPLWHDLTANFVLPLFPEVMKQQVNRAHWDKII